MPFEKWHPGSTMGEEDRDDGFVSRRHLIAGAMVSSGAQVSSSIRGRPQVISSDPTQAMVELLTQINANLQNDQPQGIAWGLPIQTLQPPFPYSVGLFVFPMPLFSLTIINNYSNAFQYRIPGGSNGSWITMPAVPVLAAGTPSLDSLYVHTYLAPAACFTSIAVQAMPGYPTTPFQFYLRGWY